MELKSVGECEILPGWELTMAGHDAAFSHLVTPAWLAAATCLSSFLTVPWSLCSVLSVPWKYGPSCVFLVSSSSWRQWGVSLFSHLGSLLRMSHICNRNFERCILKTPTIFGGVFLSILSVFVSYICWSVDVYFCIFLMNLLFYKCLSQYLFIKIFYNYAYFWCTVWV